MALYRLHRKEWDKSFQKQAEKTSSKKNRKKRKLEESIDGQKSEVVDHTESKKKTRIHEESFPGGGRKGVSSGLSTVVKVFNGMDWSSKSEQSSPDWWGTV